MATAVFQDATGVITHIVKTEGLNAERDLAFHTQGKEHVRFEDIEYSKMSDADLIARVSSLSTKAVKPPPLNPSTPGDPAKVKAREDAFADSLSKGKTIDEARADGQRAVDAIAAQSAQTESVA